ncbi:hypothetical protein QOT17_009897 [Balamuthia mandrillaris]
MVNIEPLEGPAVRLTVVNCSFVGGVGAISMSLGVKLSAGDCRFERLAGTAIRGFGKSSFDIAAGSARFERWSCHKFRFSLVSFTNCNIIHNQATTAIQNNKYSNITTLPKRRSGGHFLHNFRLPQLWIRFAVEVVNHPDAVLSANITKTHVENGSESIRKITFTSGEPIIMSSSSDKSARAKAVLTASFISTGLIDGRRFSNVTVAYEGDFRFSVTTGYCPVNFVFDPNFSTLINVFEDGGETEEGESREEEDEG